MTQKLRRILNCSPHRPSRISWSRQKSGSVLKYATGRRSANTRPYKEMLSKTTTSPRFILHTGSLLRRRSRCWAWASIHALSTAATPRANTRRVSTISDATIHLGVRLASPDPGKMFNRWLRGPEVFAPLLVLGNLTKPNPPK